MHTLIALGALALLQAGPVEKTVHFGNVVIQLKQKVADGTVTCDIVTTIDGAHASLKHLAEFTPQPDFTACFELPRAQVTPGFFMVRENLSSKHTVLISEQGKVLDIDQSVARSGAWEPML